MYASDQDIKKTGWECGDGGVLAGNPQNHSRQTDDSCIRRCPRGVRMLFVFKMGFTWGFVTSFSGAFNLI